MTEEVEFVAELSQVTEVSLMGAANLGYWQDRLRPHGLSPAPHDGDAQILIIASKARFMGIPFHEVTFSVIVFPTQERHALQDAACLLRAFNSNRLLAFMERTFFGTPYYPAKCKISLDPIAVAVSNGNRALFSAQIGGAGHRDLTQLEDDGWYGTVAIIPPEKHTNAPYKYFVAKVAGQTTIYPFDSSSDTLVVPKDSGVPEFSQLVESGFSGRQWIVRASANHAKSRTYTLIPKS